MASKGVIRSHIFKLEARVNILLTDPYMIASSSLSNVTTYDVYYALKICNFFISTLS